jgi:hypothetical protein
LFGALGMRRSLTEARQARRGVRVRRPARDRPGRPPRDR